MALKPKHRREIRDLLRILYDDKAWQPVHTDRLLTVVRATRSDVAEDIETTVTQDLAAANRANLAVQGQLMAKLREVDSFRDELKNQHAKIAAFLEAAIDLPMMKARVKDEATGEWHIDPSLISDKDAKIGLAAVEKILKITGAFVQPKPEDEAHEGSAFELPDWEG